MASAERVLRAATIVVGAEGVGDDISSSVGVTMEFVWMEMQDFSSFSSFWVKLAVVDRVSRAVVAVDNAMDSNMVVCDCDSKKTPNNSPLPCPEGY